VLRAFIRASICRTAFRCAPSGLFADRTATCSWVPRYAVGIAIITTAFFSSDFVAAQSLSGRPALLSESMTRDTSTISEDNSASSAISLLESGLVELTDMPVGGLSGETGDRKDYYIDIERTSVPELTLWSSHWTSALAIRISTSVESSRPQQTMPTAKVTFLRVTTRNARLILSSKGVTTSAFSPIRATVARAQGNAVKPSSGTHHNGHNAGKRHTRGPFRTGFRLSRQLSGELRGSQFTQRCRCSGFHDLSQKPRYFQGR
jgi:hypothetical protein